MDLFLLKKALTALVLPPTGPLLIALLGLVVLARHPRSGRALAWFGLSLLLVLSLPTVSASLMYLLDHEPALDLQHAEKAQAIVILGGGVRRNALEYGGDTLGRLTLERVRYGARVARQTGLPVLVTGGVVYGGTAEALLMQRALEEEYGVKVRWVERQSRNTHENAVNTGRILSGAGVSHIILVAHSMDMPRARAELAAAGLEVIAAATGIPHGPFASEPDSLLELLPSVGALQGSYYALYELLAAAMRRLGL